ncbi:MAG: DUF4421 family protein [Bacteroidota bacterium]
MKHLFLLVFYLLPAILFAQLDTIYIKPLPNTKVVSVHSLLRQFRLSFSSPNSEPVFFENYNLALGVRLKYKKIGLSFAVPVARLEDKSLGDSKAYVVGFGLYPKSFFVQGDMRYIQGLYDFRDNRFREDMRAVYASFFGLHLFNADRLSLRSAFNLVNRQQRSAGSWLVSSVLEYQYFRTDSLALFAERNPLSITQYNSYKLGLGGGYAQSWVKGNWSMTGLASGGIEFRRLNYQSMQNTNFQDRFLLSPRLRFFGSVIYNADHLFYGVSGNYLPRLDVADQLNTRVMDWTIRLSLGWRFY